MKIKEALNEMSDLNDEVKRILKKISYKDYDDLSGLKNDGSPEDALIRDELVDAAGHLDKFRRIINYLNRKVVKQGVLKLNERGRYEIVEDEDEYEYTSADLIEFLYYDDYDEREKWCISRVEATKGKYYIVGYEKIKMDGLKVRVREKLGIFEF